MVMNKFVYIQVAFISKILLFYVCRFVFFAIYLHSFVGFSQIVQLLRGINSEQYAFYYSFACLLLNSRKNQKNKK